MTARRGFSRALDACVTRTGDGDVRAVPSAAAAAFLNGTATRDAEGSRAVPWCTDADESALVRVEVRHRDGAMAALANPVTLTGPKGE